MQTTRTLKVYPSLQSPYPRINLQGKWLQLLGFNIGNHIEVTAKFNQLIVTNNPIKSYNMKSKKLKVYPSLQSPYPRINLQGKWIQLLGFDVGNRIEVTVSDNQLIITNIDEHSTTSTKPKEVKLGRRPNNYYLGRKLGGI